MEVSCEINFQIHFNFEPSAEFYDYNLQAVKTTHENMKNT